MEIRFTISGESIMNLFRTILGTIVYVLVMLLLVIIFGLMMFSAWLMDNILECFDFYFQERSQYNRSLFLTKILSFLNRWDKEIKETIIWAEKSFKIAKLSPFVKC